MDSQFRRFVRTLILSGWVASFVAVTTVVQTTHGQSKLPHLKSPKGFAMTIFAAPPQVNYPTCLTATPTGEVFVGIDKQGSMGKKTGQGRVVKCVDTNGDGKADQFTTFAKIDHPRGLVYRDGKLWVLHPPFLSLYHDTNGDGKAERKETLVTGLSTDWVFTKGASHTTNGIRMGIDGWLYIAVGDFGFLKAKGKDGKTQNLRGGGVVRVRPDGTELEIFAQGLRNVYDVAVDPQLNIFTRGNANDGGGWNVRLTHIIQSANYGYPSLFRNFPDEVLPPLADYGNGAGSGGLFIQEPWLPKPYRRVLLTADWGRNRIFAHPMTKAGASFHADQKEFIQIDRPTDLDSDGIGGIYVSSWFNGKYTYTHENVGFVAKIFPKRKFAEQIIPVRKLGNGKLVTALRSSSHTRRLHVQHEILRRGSVASVIADLECLMNDKQSSLDVRVAAIFTYKQLLKNKANAKFVQLADTDSTVREFSLRALTDRTTQLHDVPLRLFVGSLQDENPRVRLAALVGLGRLGNKAAAKAILKLANPPQNNKDVSAPVIPHVAVRTLVQLDAAEDCLRALVGPFRFGAAKALQSMHSPKVVSGLLAKLQTESNRERRHLILQTLMRLYHKEAPYKGTWWGTRPDTTGPYYDAMAWKETPKIAQALRQTLLSAHTARNKKTVAFLLVELARHRIELRNLPPKLAIRVSKLSRLTPTISVAPPEFDPNNPKQVGNIPFATILQRMAGNNGNVALGKKLFVRQSCHACHTTAFGQLPLGPSLVDIGKRYSQKELATSILKPSDRVPPGFAANMFLLKNGTFRTGFVLREGARDIEIRTREGKSLLVPREAIKKRMMLKKSIMPEGLVNNLTVDELASLVAYLQSLQGKGTITTK